MIDLIPDGKEYSERYKREMEEYQRATDPDVVPIYERADIRPRELAVLRRKIVELESRLKQADEEAQAQDEIIHYLFAELGFTDWEITLDGARAVLRVLTDLVAGRISVEEFGGKGDAPDGSFLAGLIELIEKGDEWEAKHLPAKKFKR